MSMLSYFNSDFITFIFIDYIWKLGYTTRVHCSANYQVVVPPFYSGLVFGELCNMGDIQCPMPYAKAKQGGDHGHSSG
jgi:hypothetical protein